MNLSDISKYLKFKIMSGHLFVSYDGGCTYSEDLGVVQGADGKDGADSSVPGQDGQQGEQGPKGEDGTSVSINAVDGTWIINGQPTQTPAYIAKPISVGVSGDEGQVGTPSVTTQNDANGIVLFFHQLKGAQGNAGPAPRINNNNIWEVFQNGSWVVTGVSAVGVGEKGATGDRGPAGLGINFKESAADCEEANDGYISTTDDSTKGHLFVLTQTDPEVPIDMSDPTTYEFIDYGSLVGPKGDIGPKGPRGNPIFFVSTISYDSSNNPVFNVEDSQPGDYLVYMGSDESVVQKGEVFKRVDEGSVYEPETWADQGYNMRGPKGDATSLSDSDFDALVSRLRGYPLYYSAAGISITNSPNGPEIRAVVDGRTIKFDDEGRLMAVLDSSTITALGYKWDVVKNSFAEGDPSNVTTPQPLALGIRSHAEGKGSTPTALMGSYTWAAGSTTLSCTSSTLPSSDSIIAFNNNNNVYEYRKVLSSAYSDNVGTVVIDAPFSQAGTSVGLYKVFGVAYGEGSHVEGENGMALYEGSHSEGISTVATSHSSHAEGYQSKAAGEASHAEGHNTEAGYDYAHAEGHDTHAIGEASHTEGDDTYATSQAAHAEGFDTRATAFAAHSEGTHTEACGEASHVEGVGECSDVGKITISAPSISSQTFYYGNLVSAILSDFPYDSYRQESETDEDVWNRFIYPGVVLEVTEGDGPIWLYVLSTYFGTPNGINAYVLCPSGDYFSEERSIRTLRGVAYGRGAHAEGLGVALGDYSHAEGSSVASGEYSHAEGYHNLALGDNSHVSGEGNIARRFNQTVVGQYNDYTGDIAQQDTFVIGNGSDDSHRSNLLLASAATV